MSTVAARSRPRTTFAPVVHVHRLVAQFVSALAVLIALAIFDLGPRADAAYLSMAAQPVSANLDASTQTDDTPIPPTKTERIRVGLLALDGQLPGGGGMTSTSSGPSSGSSPVFGDLSRVDVPLSGLVVYYREPPASLELSAFIDTILDPPRQV